MVNAGLKVGTQTGFRYLPFCVACRFKHECLAQIPCSQTRLRRSHALVGSGNQPARFLFIAFIPQGDQLLKSSRQYRRLAELLRQRHDLVQFAVVRAPCASTTV